MSSVRDIVFMREGDKQALQQYEKNDYDSEDGFIVRDADDSATGSGSDESTIESDVDLLKSAKQHSARQVDEVEHHEVTKETLDALRNIIAAVRRREDRYTPGTKTELTWEGLYKYIIEKDFKSEKSGTRMSLRQLTLVRDDLNAPLMMPDNCLLVTFSECQQIGNDRKKANKRKKVDVKVGHASNAGVEKVDVKASKRACKEKTALAKRVAEFEECAECAKNSGKLIAACRHKRACDMHHKTLRRICGVCSCVACPQCLAGQCAKTSGKHHLPGDWICANCFVASADVCKPHAKGLFQCSACKKWSVDKLIRVPPYGTTICPACLAPALKTFEAVVE